MTGETPSPTRITAQVVFILGLHRSGTTLLADLIGRHSQASGFSDTGVFMDEGQYLQSVIRSRDGAVLDGTGSLGLKLKNYLTERSRMATPEQAERLWQEWSAHWDLSRRWLIEKSPSHMTKTRLLRYFFPSARFVVITRNPIAQAMAIQKWVPNRSRLQFFLNWLVSHEAMRRDLRGVDYILVRYEDLCSQPEKTMAQIFKHIDAPWENVLHRELKNSNPKYIAAWQSETRSRRIGLEGGIVRMLLNTRFRRWGYDSAVLDDPTNSGDANCN